MHVFHPCCFHLFIYLWALPFFVPSVSSPTLQAIYPSFFTQRALNFYQAADNSPMTEAVNQKWTQKILVGHFPQ